MRIAKSLFAPIIILSALVVLQACKAKKAIQKPAEPVAAATAPVVEQPKSAPVAPPPPPAAPVVTAPDYNFSNIQFEFNSSVLKTEAYAILDKPAAAMKADASVKFTLKGYASEEGTSEHNMTLSQDRANSVKEYLVNSGVSANSLTAKGYGTSNPVADNNAETGKVLNRRVEVSRQN